MMMTVIETGFMSSKPRQNVGNEPCCENCKYYECKFGTYKCISSGNMEGGTVPTDRWCKDFWPRLKEVKNDGEM